MRLHVSVLAALLLATALAGCGESPPSGEFAKETTGFGAVAGTAEIEYQEKVRPDDDAGVDSGIGDQICSNPELAEQADCQEPFTNVTVHFMAGADALPDPGQSSTYEVFFVNDTDERRIGALDAADDGSYNLDRRYEENLEGAFDAVEVRFEGIAIATSGAGEGSNSFEIVASVNAVTFDATWEAEVLTLTVSGMDANATYVGWLVDEDESGNQTHAEQFEISSQEVTHTASKEIGEFAEFHIHLGASKINVAKATIA